MVNIPLTQPAQLQTTPNRMRRRRDRRVASQAVTAPWLLPSPHLLGDPRPLQTVVQRYRGIVGGLAPLGPILLRRHAVLVAR